MSDALGVSTAKARAYSITDGALVMAGRGAVSPAAVKRYGGEKIEISNWSG